MSSAVAYRIVGWLENFENNRTKELRSMQWVPMPTKHDGDGYTEFMDHPDGAAHFGAWCAMVQVAAKCDPRGTLLRDARNGVRLGHDAESLARIVRIPAAIMRAAMDRALSIGWLEAISPETGELVESSQLPAGLPHEPAAMGGRVSHEPAALVRAEARGRDKEEKTGKTGQDTPRRAVTGARDAATMPLPQQLDSPRFRQVLGEWFDYRKVPKNGGPWTDKTLELNLREWAEDWGPERAIAAIYFTMKKGWQGIKEPDARDRQVSNPPVQFPERKNAAAEFMERQRAERAAEAQAEAAKDIA